MSDQNNTHPPQDPLDELVDELFGWNWLVTHMISSMLRSEANGHSHPDAPPIPDVAHRLIRDEIEAVCRRHSAQDIEVATTILAEAADAVSENIFIVNPEAY